MSITISIEPPGYREPDVRKDLVGIKPVMAFYGDCLGVAIIKTDPNELKLSFVMLVEDDGSWGELCGGACDSYWLPEMVEALQAAHHWVKANARRCKDRLGWEAKR